MPVEPLVEVDLWTQHPADLPRLLALLPRADLYLQDEVQFAFHPTLTRIWSLKGRRGQRLTELSDQLSLVYTPPYDPDANRIEWLWRISRRVVTHNHHRSDFESRLSDTRRHFETLTRTPDDLLRHIGSPFAPDKRPPQSQLPAA